MRLLAWSIEKDISRTLYEARHLLETAKIFNKNIEFVGQSIEYTMLRDKLYTLLDYINPIDENELIVCIDGYDTLINDTPDKIERIYEKLDTEVIVSAERLFTYQWGSFKDKFDQINSPYKYVNSGTLIGRVKFLKTMLEECIELNDTHPTTIDQGLVGVWVYKNIDNENKVKLDTNCEATWVVSGEWNVLKEQSEHPIIKNPTTDNIPIIIHSPGNKADFHFKCFQSAYNTILSYV